MGKAGQEADGGDVGGGGGGVGLRGEAARRSGAASEVAVWACGVAAAAKAAATAPGLRLFILGALGAGGRRLAEARESGVWCMRFSAEPEGEHMRTSGLLGAGGGGAAGAEAGAAGCAKLGAGAEAVLSRIQTVQTSWARFHLSTFAILQAVCRAATGGSPPAHAFRRASPRVQRCAGACVSRSLLRARCTLGFERAFLLRHARWVDFAFLGSLPSYHKPHPSHLVEGRDPR